jgi:hypothetical protein
MDFELRSDGSGETAFFCGEGGGNASSETQETEKRKT